MKPNGLWCDTIIRCKFIILILHSFVVMSSIKKNFAYNSFLSVSSHLINLILFPYCARVLGVERFGTVNFAQNIVQYALFIAAMGITHIGVREIAKQTDRRGRNQCFSNMLSLNILFTLVAMLLYIPAIFLFDRLEVQKELFLIGSFQILFSAFSVEWFFRGIENYKFITIRSLLIRILYVISVFILVKDSDDYVLFFLLTVLSTIVNAAVNFIYARKFVSFTFKGLDLKIYFGSAISLGCYSILTSMYTTFNVTYLGFVWNDIQVGYYTTALKIYTVILGFYTAFTSVMLPRMSSILNNNDESSFKNLIDKSFELLLMVSLPLVVCLMMMAPETIEVLAGDEYEPAVILSRIIMPMLFVVGIAQILVFQIIIPKGFDFVTLKASFIGAVIGVLLNILLTPRLMSVGTCITVVATELCVTGYYFYFVKMKQLFELDISILKTHLLCAIPYIPLCGVAKFISGGNSFSGLGISVFICILYFVLSQIYLIKNSFIRKLLKLE